MTNYERIKSMSVKEMARILCSKSECADCVAFDLCDVADKAVYNGFEKWLESEEKHNDSSRND